MADMIRIANAGGGWGDDPMQLRRQLEFGPVDYVTLGFLGEATPSILQKQRARDPRAGHARDFVRQVEEALPLLREHGARVLTDAGGVNPLACRAALLEMSRLHGAALEVAAIVGDDLVLRLGELNATGVPLDHAQSGAPFTAIRARVSSANVRYGAWPAQEALHSGAQIVVTGCTTAGALALAPMIHAFGWAPDDWDRLAAGTVAGHIAACGAQSTAGDCTDWCCVPDLERIGFPLLEVLPDGSFIVTRHEGTGASITVRMVKERLMRGVGDPRSHDTPDVVVDFASLRLEPAGPDRVRVWGVRGRPAPGTLRVDLSYFDGWEASGSVLVSGPAALEKARACAGRFWARLGPGCAASGTAFVGHSACWGGLAPSAEPPEVLLRLSARDPDPAKIERFARLVPTLALSGLPGVVLVDGQPPVREVVACWPARAPRERVKPTLVTREGERALDWPAPFVPAQKPRPLPASKWPPARGSRRHRTARLAALAHARSGDLGDTLSIGVIARAPEVYPWLRQTLTAPVVKRRFEGLHPNRVVRHELPNLWALIFLLHGTLDRGGADSLRLDPEGRTLALALLALEVKVPRALLEAAARGDAQDGRRTATTKQERHPSQSGLVRRRGRRA